MKQSSDFDVFTPQAPSIAQLFKMRCHSESSLYDPVNCRDPWHQGPRIENRQQRAGCGARNTEDPQDTPPHQRSISMNVAKRNAFWSMVHKGDEIVLPSTI